MLQLDSNFHSIIYSALNHCDFQSSSNEWRVDEKQLFFGWNLVERLISDWFYRGSLVMYDSASCSYAGALELKGASGAGAAAAAAGVTAAGVKQENWPYRGLTCGSTFQRLKESVDKAKQALADRGGYLSGAFSPPPRANPSAISPTASITGE